MTNGVDPGPHPVRARRRWHLLPAVGVGLLISGVLVKLALWLAIVHVDLAAAHAGLATAAVAYGMAAMLLGFAMRWTDRFYGLSQIMWADLYEEIGLWMIRLGYGITTAGVVAVLITRYF